MLTHAKMNQFAEPFSLIRIWLDEAEQQEINDANAIALSSVDANGHPNIRIVLLKAIESDAFVFYTNYTSSKAQELAKNPYAAFVVHWKSLQRQIRVRGVVKYTDNATADSYFASRNLGSRIGSWASRQSAILPNRAVLEARVAAKRHILGNNPPRPAFWGGFCLRPLSVEFWQARADRLHDRFLWSRQHLKDSWQVNRLYP